MKTELASSGPEGEDAQLDSVDLDLAQNRLHSDKPLTPKMISSLMHVHVIPLGAHSVELNDEHAFRTSPLYITAVIITSLCIVMLVGTAVLFTYKLGPFYTVAEAVRK